MTGNGRAVQHQRPSALSHRAGAITALGALLLVAFGGGAARAAEPGTPLQLPAPNSCIANAAIGGCVADPFNTFLNPLGVEVAPDGADVYVANQSADIGHFRRDRSTNALTPAGSFPAAPGFSLHEVLVAPGGDRVLASGGSTSNDGRIEAFSRSAASGDLTPLGCADEAGGDGCKNVDGLGGADGLAIAPSGPGVYVASPYGSTSTEGSIVALALDASSGAFTQLRCVAALDAVSGPCGAQSTNEPVLKRAEAAAVSPDGRHVYFGGFGGLVGYNRDPDTGNLVSEAECMLRIGSEPLCPQEDRLPNITELTMSPDGEFLFAGGDLTLAVLDRNPISGTLSVTDCMRRPVSASPCPEVESFQGASGIASSPSGRQLYTVAGTFTEGRINAFNLDPATGKLGGFACVSFTGTGGCAAGAGLLRAHSVDVSDDGRALYVGSYEGTGTGDPGALASFRIEQPPPPGPPADAADTTVTIDLLGKRLRINRRGVTRIRLRCPAAEQSPPCSGRLLLRTRGKVELGRAKSSKRRRLTLARARFEVAAGATRAVRLKLAARKLRLLKRSSRARRVVAIADVADAAGNRRSVRKPLLAVTGRRRRR